MEQVLIYFILLIQFAIVGFLIYWRNESRKQNNNDQALTLLQGMIQNQGANLSDTLMRNNDQMAKNFYGLNENVLQKLVLQKENMTKDLFEFRTALSNDLMKNLEERYEKMTFVIQDKLDRIDRKVQENLNEGFKKTNETFTGIIQRLAKIDEAQKKIESLSSNVVSLQDVLTDKKSRGIFGEVQLNNLLSSVFGDPGKYYQTQYKLSEGKLADAALMLPEPVGLLCVDSKFPLENYKRMFEEASESDRANARREFVKNVKKHVDDISSKYIIKNETSDQAIMFVPAEAIFAEIHAHHSDIVEYANTRRVWIASPTTFMATLTTIQTVMINMERSKYMKELHIEINKLGDEFKRYEDRWNQLSKHLTNVKEDADKIHITTGKISKQFQRIMQVEIEGTNPDLVDFSSQLGSDGL